MLLRFVTLALASAALYSLVSARTDSARPALTGVAAPMSAPGVTVTVTAALSPAPAPLAASAGQSDLWLGYRDGLCADYHEGAMDFCAPQGTPVYAPASGTLTEVGSYSDTLRYGAYVIIATPAELEIYVGHLNHETVNPLGLAVGAWVEAGTPIGDLSEFAYSQPHTHLQLRRAGALVGPVTWWAEWEGR